MCNALQHTLTQRNTTDDFFDVALASDFEISEIEEEKSSSWHKERIETLWSW